MHPGLALVAGQRGSLGDFPSLGSYFLERSTDLRVRFNGRSLGHVQKGTKLNTTGHLGATQNKQ